MPLISCSNVNIKYDSRIAVKDTSLELNVGDYLCVIGENGSGKSTLIKGILGLVKFTGEISFQGAGKMETGYLPQHTNIRNDFPASVYEVVLSGRMGRGSMLFYGREDKERAKKCMEKFGVSHLAKNSFKELSGGQRQRVLLARALCAAGKLLMLDEPATGLDPAGTVEMYSILSALNRDEGVTIMMITHDIKSAVKNGNKILHMRTSPIYFGSAAGYLNTPEAVMMQGGA